MKWVWRRTGADGIPRLSISDARAMPAPWVQVDAAGLAAAVAAHAADYAAWLAGPHPPAPRLPPYQIEGENGTRWKIDAGGSLVPA